MEASLYVHGHGYIVKLLVIFLFSASSLASKINNSHNVSGIRIHNPRKLLLQGGKSFLECKFETLPVNGQIGIACHSGNVFSEIKFAYYGSFIGRKALCIAPPGDGYCKAPNALSFVQKRCLRKTHCQIFMKDLGAVQCSMPNINKGPYSFQLAALCSPPK